MANRRMFSRAVTGSGRFLRLSPTARALYYDLGMEADDDGFVEAFVRLRATGAEEVHLGELERAGLIAVVDPENPCRRSRSFWRSLGRMRPVNLLAARWQPLVNQPVFFCRTAWQPRLG